MISNLGRYNAGGNNRVSMIDKCPDNLRKRCERMLDTHEIVTDVTKVVEDGWINYKAVMRLKER